MPLIKIASGSNVNFQGNVVASIPSTPSPTPTPAPALQFQEISLNAGTNDVGTHGDSVNVQAFPSITIPSLPYTVPSGILKGLRITTTPTLSSDFKAAASQPDADGIFIQNASGNLVRHHFNPNNMSWVSGLRVITSIPQIAPDRQLRFVTGTGSTLGVWYKWSPGQWT